MASIGEMLALAQYVGQGEEQQRYGLPEALGAGIKGYQAGREGRLDQAIKIIEARKLMAEVEEREQNLKISRNISKGAGILPYDEADVSTGKRGILGILNFAKGHGADAVKTEKSKVAQMVDKGLGMPSMEDYEISIGGGVGGGEKGFKYTIGKKKVEKGKEPTPAQYEASQGRIMSLAMKLAKAEDYELHKDNPDYINKIMNDVTYVPPQDLTIKYTKMAREWFKEGTLTELETEIERRGEAKKKAKGWTEIGDPAKYKR